MKAVERLLTADRAGGDRRTSAAVAKIVSAVRARGDAALLAYAQRFDRLDGDLEVSRDEIEELAVRVPPKVRAAIAAAARNIEKVARRQRPQGWTVKTAPGVTVEQRVTPLDRVGCYVPGGRYPLPSSLLMTAIPARAAGVREIIVACPRPAPVVMAAARAAGVTTAVSEWEARRRLPPWRTARRPFRASTRSSAPAISTSPRRRRSSPPTAPSISTPALPRSSSSRTRAIPSGSRPI